MNKDNTQKAKSYFSIHTLHRGKYMGCFLFLLFLAGGISSLIPASEIVKIIAVLFTIPGILYVSVKVSQNPSQWALEENKLTISFKNKTYTYPFAEIDHIRSLTRSGGNLYVIYLHKKSPARYWRNKLFQKDDDHQLLHEVLLQSTLDYYKF